MYRFMSRKERQQSLHRNCSSPNRKEENSLYNQLRLFRFFPEPQSDFRIDVIEYGKLWSKIGQYQNNIIIYLVYDLFIVSICLLSSLSNFMGHWTVNIGLVALWSSRRLIGGR